jgi:hypothetical protein
MIFTTETLRTQRKRQWEEKLGFFYSHLILFSVTSVSLW